MPTEYTVNSHVVVPNVENHIGNWRQARMSKSWNAHPDFITRFLLGEFKDRHPVALELLDWE